MICIEKNTVVCFRYIMKDEKGHAVEDTMNGMPKYYLHGSAGIQSSLQLQFEGLMGGDTKIIHLSDDLANASFTFDIIIDEVRPALEEEIMLGYPVVTSGSICDEDCWCYKSENNG